MKCWPVKQIQFLSTCYWTHGSLNSLTLVLVTWAKECFKQLQKQFLQTELRSYCSPTTPEEDEKLFKASRKETRIHCSGVFFTEVANVCLGSVTWCTGEELLFASWQFRHRILSESQEILIMALSLNIFHVYLEMKITHNSHLVSGNCNLQIGLKIIDQ